MSTQHDIELWTQQNLRMLAKDELSLGYFSSGNIDSVPDYTLHRWQLSVDMIYRCIVSGLLEVDYAKYREDYGLFIHDIRTNDPYKEPGSFVWLSVQLYGTPRLLEIVKSHFPETSQYDPSLNATFIAELKAIFEKNGVPWSDAPLLPVATT